MKKTLSLALAGALCLGLAGCGRSGANLAWSVILLVLGTVVLLFGAWRLWQYLQHRKRRMKRGRKVQKVDLATLLVIFLGVVLLVVGLLIPAGEKKPKPPKDPETQQTDPQDTEPTTEPPIVFAPYKTGGSDPDYWGVKWEIFRDGQAVQNFNRTEPIELGEPEDYFALPGVATFRGNNYRNDSTYGTAQVVNKQLSTVWTANTGTLTGGVWSGSGWTGQPLVVRWDDATRAIMNLYPDKKAKSDLVEVIYATLDGHIYFYDLDDGSATRDSLDLGMCFKGAGALDPRGYPIMYVGSGDVNYYGDRPRAYILSLIDGKILYTFGQDDPLSLRQDNDRWTAFDSSPLVDAETDTLIWPGENGLLYTMKLNTQYNKSAGTISVSPTEQTVARYTTDRSGSEQYWYGFEASVSVCEGYLYVSENGGMFYCVDLNTMELIWAQDTKDDSNCSPVFERTAEDAGAVYTAPSLHWTQNEYANGIISLYKLDAMNGQILWQKLYNVYTVSGVSGGVQSTPLLGRPGSNLQNMIFYTISRTPDLYNGILIALDKETGEDLWKMDMTHYAWSSPVAFYDEAGNGYLAVGDSDGNLFLLDGATGTLLQTMDLGGIIEATPVVYENRLVVGTRSEKVYCIEIS